MTLQRNAYIRFIFLSISYSHVVHSIFLPFGVLAIRADALFSSQTSIYCLDWVVRGIDDRIYGLKRSK